MTSWKSIKKNKSLKVVVNVIPVICPLVCRGGCQLSVTKCGRRSTTDGVSSRGEVEGADQHNINQPNCVTLNNNNNNNNNSA